MRIPEEHGGAAVHHSTRLGARTVIVFVLAFAITIATVVVPARAGETTAGDLDGVRATVLETYNWKINSLTEKKAATDNSARIEVYAGGISQLTNLRDERVASEPNIEELWALKSTAYGIYESTIAAAANAGMTEAEVLAKAKNKTLSTIEYKIKLLRDWIAEREDRNARAIIDAGIAKIKTLRGELDGVTNADLAWNIKDRTVDIYHATISAAEAAKDDDTDKEPTEAERAAEALAKTRRSTLTMIERKTSILGSAAKAARVPAVIEVFRVAAVDVADLAAPAKSAKTIKALKEIQDNVVSLYAAAKKSAAEVVGHDDNEDRDDATDAIASHLTKTTNYVNSVTDRAEWSAERSPDTWAALVAAQDKVVTSADAVREVMESGRRLGVRWEDLNKALSAFRRALVTHYIAIDSGPTFVGGFHVAG